MNMAKQINWSAIELFQRASWEARRANRNFNMRFGMAGYVVPACILIISLTLLYSRSLDQSEKQYLANAKSAKLPVTKENYSFDARSRMTAFEQYLLPHEMIPDTVQALLDLAHDEKLSISRGEYKSFVDVEGQFLRYRMTLPVKGDSQAIYRFIKEALRTQHSLALESVQFKRERIQSSEMDVRIQWVILTRLPGTTTKTVSGLD